MNKKQLIVVLKSKIKIIMVLLCLLLTGCASVPIIEEKFDPANFESMDKIAILVRDLNIKVGTVKNPYKTPVVCYVSNMKIPIGPIPISGGFSLTASYEETQYLVDNVRTEKLQAFIKNYNIKDIFFSEFSDELKKIKSFTVLPSEKVDELFKSHYRLVLEEANFEMLDAFQSEFNSFKNGLVQTLAADTLITIDLGLWGFHLRRNFFSFLTSRGNLIMMGSLKIIRLSDGETLFDDYVSVDFSESSSWRENRVFEEVIKEDEQFFFQNLHTLIQKTVREIIKPLKG